MSLNSDYSFLQVGFVLKNTTFVVLPMQQNQPTLAVLFNKPLFQVI